MSFSSKSKGKSGNKGSSTVDDETRFSDVGADDVDSQDTSGSQTAGTPKTNSQGHSDLDTSGLSSQATVMDTSAPILATAPKEDLSPEEVTLKHLQRWVEKDVSQIHISMLRWDCKQQWGQIRPLSTNQVDLYYQSVKKTPPRVPVRALVRSSGGMHNYNDSA